MDIVEIKDRRPEEELAIVVIGNFLAISFTLATNFIIPKGNGFLSSYIIVGFYFIIMLHSYLTFSLAGNTEKTLAIWIGQRKCPYRRVFG